MNTITPQQSADNNSKGLEAQSFEQHILELMFDIWAKNQISSDENN